MMLNNLAALHQEAIMRRRTKTNSKLRQSMAKQRPNRQSRVEILQLLVWMRSLSISKMVVKTEMPTAHLKNRNQSKIKVLNLISKTRKHRTIKLKKSLKRKRRKVVEKNLS